MALTGAEDTSLGSLAGMGIGAAVGGPMGAMVGSSAGGLLGSLLGGSGADKGAIELLKQAQARLAAIREPTAEDLKLILSPLVQQGIITPQDYQTISQQPSAFVNMNIDPTGRNAEISALNEMGNIASQGGNDAQYRAAIQNAINTGNTQLQGQNDSVLQNAAARGSGNSNLTAAAQLANNQNQAANMNTATTNAAANAEQRALEAMSNQANIGSNVNQQDTQAAQTKAAAIDAINRYNSQNAQAQSNLTTGTRNAAQATNLGLAQDVANQNTGIKNQQATYNAQIPETMFQNSVAKATGANNMTSQQANLLQQGSQNKATTQGNIIGGLGQQIGNYANNQALLSALSKQQNPQQGLTVNEGPANQGQTSGYGWSKGGKIPGKPMVKGDSPENDTVPAMLSAGEGVLPRSVMGKSDDEVLKFFHGMKKNKNVRPVHPKDVQTLLQALTEHRYSGGEVCS